MHAVCVMLIFSMKIDTIDSVDIGSYIYIYTDLYNLFAFVFNIISTFDLRIYAYEELPIEYNCKWYRPNLFISQWVS